jgi:signal transduction histidine kinase
VYWLRRIPAETRIVVLVVFLALFQALLLSVFGLGAIRGERRKAAETLRQTTQEALRQFVAAPCQNELRAFADEVFLAAYDEQAAGWQKRPPVPGGHLFTHALTVRPDGAILESTGRMLSAPREVARASDETARSVAVELALRFMRGEEKDKLEADLAFAERYPFSRDEFGQSLALLFAASPLLAGEGAPSVDTLLRMRRVGVLNRVTGVAEAPEVAAFLRRVDAAGATGHEYLAGVEQQTREEQVLRALASEAGRFAPAAPPRLHVNMVAPEDVPFYVRRVRGGGFQVLVVDPEEMRRLLDRVAARASKEASVNGLDPRVMRGVPNEDDPWIGIETLPGYVATARISDAAVRERAGGRERFYWYIIAVSVAGIFAGGFWTARTVAREVKLAKLKSGFVSNVSHELKTPLTSIRMFAEMLSSGRVTDDAEREECLEVITQETERLSRLIQQVLDFGRLQSRQRRFDWREASLGPVVAREAARFRRATGLSETQFEVHVAVNLPAVSHDPDAFSEVVANLLSNAYKYSPPEKLIVLTLGPLRGRVVLAVEDNGPGIPARERRHIFEQFYRADDLLTREVEGTGLGLSIARNIVRAHGGRILVEDAEGGGARFVVVLPAVSHPSQPQAAAPAETTT